jgi:hypothetical protein
LPKNGPSLFCFLSEGQSELSSCCPRRPRKKLFCTAVTIKIIFKKIIYQNPKMSGLYSEGVIYYGTPQVSAWQGLNFYTTPDQFMIVGTRVNNGTLFVGDINLSNGTFYNVVFPGIDATSVYSGIYLSDDNVRLVGSIKYVPLKEVQPGVLYTSGFLYEGTLNEFNDSLKYIKYEFPSVSTYLHSTAGDLIVVS